MNTLKNSSKIKFFVFLVLMLMVSAGVLKLGEFINSFYEEKTVHIEDHIRIKLTDVDYRANGKTYTLSYNLPEGSLIFDENANYVFVINDNHDVVKKLPSEVNDGDIVIDPSKRTGELFVLNENGNGN